MYQHLRNLFNFFMEGGTDQSMCPTEREEYKFYETSSYTKCFALPKTGGELASVPDKATNDFLETALIEYEIKKILWTGGMMNESKNAWMWSGEMSPLNFSNWDPHDLDFSFVDTTKTPSVNLKKEKIGFYMWLSTF